MAIEEWPIFGGLSEYAANAALLAFKTGHFAEVHDALLSRVLSSETDVDAVMTAADILDPKAQIDGAKAMQDADLQRVVEDAKRLRLTGTPTLVVGRTLVRGALSYQDLRDLIGRERLRL